MASLKPRARARRQRICPHCQQAFTPSMYRPRQRTCSQPDCQRQRKNASRRQRYQNDPLYRDTCRDSLNQFLSNHPDYLKCYRNSHPAQVKANRERQRARDQKRRLRRRLDNGAVAIDLNHYPPATFLVTTPRDGLDNRALASAKLLVFQSVPDTAPRLDKHLPIDS